MHHDNKAQHVGGLHLLWLKGSPEDRARAHAQFLCEEIKAGPLLALAKKNEWAIRRGPAPLSYSKTLQAQIVRVYRHLLMEVMERGLTQSEKNQINVISEVTGLERARVREAMFQPDAFMILSRLTVTKHLLKELPGGGIGVLGGGIPGCTSVALGPKWTKEGRLLLSRNLDYPIVGPWEKFTTVMFCESATNGQAKAEIPHVAVTSAGVHTSGLTALNREGISISVHAHFGKHISLNGRPIFSISEEVIANAKSLAESIDIVKKSKRIGNWAFIIGSAREKTAVVVEMTPSKTRVREMQDGYLGHTNYFQDKDLQKEEACLSAAYADDLEARLCRSREMLEPARGALTPAHLASSLGDMWDSLAQQERVVGNTVGVISSVQSVVMDPEVQKIWVSSREATPTGLGPFLELSLDDLWKTRHLAKDKVAFLPGYQPKDSRLTGAIATYREAFISFGMENDREDYLERTLKNIGDAVALYPEDAHLWAQNGLVAFRMQYFLQASHCFEEALARKMSVNMQGVCHLFMGRIKDLGNDRAGALGHYHFESKIHEPRLKQALKDGLRRKFKTSRIAYMILDMQFPDGFQYG